MSGKKVEENIERYLKTSIYTYAGDYKELLITLSAILKTKGIPCRSRAGFMDFHALMNNEIFLFLPAAVPSQRLSDN